MRFQAVQGKRLGEAVPEAEGLDPQQHQEHRVETTPYTLRPMPHTPHPTPYTTRPTPYTLYAVS